MKSIRTPKLAMNFSYHDECQWMKTVSKGQVMEYAFVTSRLWFRGVASSAFVLGRFDFQFFFFKC
jgi:hypothetical protein